jgi:peptidyl-prolyl cis-trans isomerase B (cyclophilin B)
MRRLAALLVPAAAALALSGCSQDNTASSSPSPKQSSPAAASPAPATPTQGSSTPAAAGSTSCTYTPTGQAARKVQLPPSRPTPARSLKITTNRGVITATLNDKATPCTANSFTSLAKQRYFDNTKCHRLTTVGIFVLQCGDPTGTGSGGPGYSFGDELSGRETYPAGTLAMANAGPNTNGSQFFLVYANTSLPPSYTVFGKIDPAGRQLVADVAKAGTANGTSDGAPKKPVVIKSVR